MTDEREDQDELEPWSEHELSEMARRLIQDGDIPVDREIVVNEVRIGLRWLNHEETEKSSRAAGRDDMLTRELHNQREILARAITTVDGRPAKMPAIMAFLQSAPPALVARLYEEYTQFVYLQASMMEKMISVVKT